MGLVAGSGMAILPCHFMVRDGNFYQTAPKMFRKQLDYKHRDTPCSTSGSELSRLTLS